MRVETLTHVYTLYVGAEGIWTMHVWVKVRGEERWAESVAHASAKDPFKSSVKYQPDEGPVYVWR